MRATQLCAVFAVVVGCGGRLTGNGFDAANGDDGTTGDQDSGPGGNGGGTTINVTLANRPTTAATFTFLTAYQDGAAAWTATSAPVGDTYSFEVHSAVWGFAYTCISSGGSSVQLREVDEVQFAVVERTSLTIDIPARCSDRAPAPVALAGTITDTNVGFGGSYVVYVGDRQAVVTRSGLGALTYAVEVPPGTYDLVALRGSGGIIIDPTTTSDFTANASLVIRGVSVTAAKTINLDFATAKATQSLPVAIDPKDTAIARTALYSAGGTVATTVLDSTSPWATVALDSSQRAAGDVYDQLIQVQGTETVNVSNATSAPGAETYTAPPALGAVNSVEATTTPYPEIRTSWPKYANAVGYQWTASQLAQGQAIVWSALVSPGITGTHPMYEMPDLTSVAGWSSSFQLVHGIQVTGTTRALTSTSGAADFPPVVPPTAGTKRTTVTAHWAVTP